MAGDQINIFGKSYWFNSGGNYSDKYPIPVSSILDAFLATLNMATKGLTTMQQLEKYKALFEKTFGGTWKTVLDTY